MINIRKVKTFHVKDFGTIEVIKDNNKTEYIMNGFKIDRFELLALADEQEDEDTAWKIMDIASKLYHWQGDDTFNCLYGAVAMDIVRHFTRDELYYHSVFKENYSKIRNGKVVKRKTDGHNIPDAWVMDTDNNVIPVEIKLNKFDAKALKQLNRYMITYNSVKGIAVAKELSVKLPDNIEFISFPELKPVENNKNK